MNNLAAVFLMTLKEFENLELAAMNNAMQTLGKMDANNIAYQKALDCNLIKASGESFDLESLQKALAYEVNRRVDAGEFK